MIYSFNVVKENNAPENNLKNNKRNNQFKNYTVGNGIDKRKKMFSNAKKKIKDIYLLETIFYK